MANKSVEQRALVLMVLSGISILGLVAQLGNLQLRQQSRFVASADVQRTQFLNVAAPRGEIHDRNGVPLAVNRPANAVIIHYPFYDYQKHPEYKQVLERVSFITGASLSKVLERVDMRLSNKDRRLWEPILVKSEITREQYAALVENKSDLPGVEVDVRPLRYYPQGALAAHAVGYVGPVNLEDIQADKGYKGDDIIGKTGIEQSYESFLRGAEGRRKVQVDYRFAPTGEAGWVREPVPGNNLVLTLDTNLQKLVERALDWQIFRIQNEYNAYDKYTWKNTKAGAAVVLDVRTGAILAMASSPGYDLNVFRCDCPDLDVVLSETPSRLWNRTINASYSPGSTWKMVTGSAALHYGVTTPWERILSGSVYAPTQQKEWLPGGHGWVDLPNALRASSNIYFYEMGSRVKIDRLVEWASIFGFGRPTGIDLPEEDPGFLPTKEYRDRQGEPWTLGSTTSAAIGQIFRATPLQLAQYAAAIANQGKILRPYVVQEVRNPKGEVLQRTEPAQAGQVPLPPELLQPIIDGMIMVNHAPTGTSDFVQWPLKGIRTAGKTGTAQVAGQDDYGLYVGFAPVDNPQIAIAVVIEQSGHGSTVSRVARTILSHYFNLPMQKGDPAIIPDEFPARKAELLKMIR